MEMEACSYNTALLAAECVCVCASVKVFRKFVRIGDSDIDFYNNKVADSKHQVTAVLQDFLVYYSIPFNHGGEVALQAVGATHF